MSYFKVAQAIDINSACKFASDFSDLLSLFNKSNFTRVAAGQQAKIYRAKGALYNPEEPEDTHSNIRPNAEIPNSEIEMDLVKNVELQYLKFRNLTSLEDVGKMGYDVAVLGTNEAMLTEVKNTVVQMFYDALEDCSYTPLPEHEKETHLETFGADLQGALANAWGTLKVACEGMDYDPVYFVNVSDVANYLGKAPLTIQQKFGMNYISDFLGLGKLVITNRVPQGTIYATSTENIMVYALNMKDTGLDVYTDPTGVIGVKNEPKSENGAYQTVMLAGVAFFPLIANKIVKATIGA